MKMGVLWVGAHNGCFCFFSSRVDDSLLNLGVGLRVVPVHVLEAEDGAAKDGRDSDPDLLGEEEGDERHEEDKQKSNAVFHQEKAERKMRRKIRIKISKLSKILAQYVTFSKMQNFLEIRV